MSFSKCLNETLQGKIKSYKNSIGVDAFAICLKDNGVYRWKSIDGKNMILKHSPTIVAPYTNFEFRRVLELVLTTVKTSWVSLETLCKFRHVQISVAGLR